MFIKKKCSTTIYLKLNIMNKSLREEAHLEQFSNDCMNNFTFVNNIILFTHIIIIII